MNEIELSSGSATVLVQDNTPRTIFMPVGYDTTSTAKNRGVLKEVERHFGVWLDWESRWMVDKDGRPNRSVSFASRQPTHMVTIHVADPMIVPMVVDPIPPFIYTWTHTEWFHDDDVAGSLICEGKVWMYGGKKLVARVSMELIERKA